MKNTIKMMSFVCVAVLFSACGDDVTEVYNNTTGMAVLETGKKLSKQTCDSTNVGEMLYVKDSLSAFVCNGKSWESLKGEDGEDGRNGYSCSAKQNKDKTITTITCETADGKVSYEVKNGSKGAAGDDGYSCSAKQNKDKSVTTITCETADGDVSYEVKNGSDGSGCVVEDSGDGVVAVVCGDGENESSSVFYKAICNNEPYDPAYYDCNDGRLFGLLTDERDGEAYGTVVIGLQEWMQENINYDLKTKKDGETVEYSVCGGRFASSKGDCEKFGRLYVENDDLKSVCPDGWHLPSKKDWETLIEYVGGSDVAGKMLKSVDGWRKPAATASDLKLGEDLFGFAMLSAGSGVGSSFGNVGQGAALWTSSVDSEKNKIFVSFYYSSDEVVLEAENVEDAYKSIRCVKD